ncbi:hypothetical protein D3C80_1996200 [compost metagenome]
MRHWWPAKVPLPKIYPPPVKRPIGHSKRIPMPAWSCMAIFNARCKTPKRRPYKKVAQYPEPRAEQMVLLQGEPAEDLCFKVHPALGSARN